MKHYTIKKGDTLSEVALTFGTTVDLICSQNSIKNPNRIYVGQVIQIPEPAVIPVDTVAKALKVALEDIRKLPSVQALEALLKG